MSIKVKCQSCNNEKIYEPTSDPLIFQSNNLSFCDCQPIKWFVDPDPDFDKDKYFFEISEGHFKLSLKSTDEIK